MIKKIIKSVALILMLAVLLFCFSSCKSKKDVYGAASEFIKVSHPDKPNTNAFSDGSYDNNTSSKSEKSKKSEKNSSKDSSTGSTSESGSVSSESSTNSSQKAEESSSGSSGATDSTSVKMSSNDYGPVVEFN